MPTRTSWQINHYGLYGKPDRGDPPGPEARAGGGSGGVSAARWPDTITKARTPGSRGIRVVTETDCTVPLHLSY